MDMVAPLQGRVALVTGGGRGIGRATAIELARHGADVALIARSVHEIDEATAAVRAEGRRALGVPVDLAESCAVVAAVATVEQGLGPVAILINNAAVVGPFGTAWQLDAEDWARAVQINLVAPFQLAHEVLPAMLAVGWGRIVNVSSGAAQHPMERLGAYSPSKAGLDMLTRLLAAEVDGSGVAVTAVYPGTVDTAMPASIRAEGAETVGALAQQFQSLYNAGALQPPEHPARVIAEIVATDGTSLNGHIVDAAGDDGQRLLEGHAVA